MPRAGDDFNFVFDIEALAAQLMNARVVLGNVQIEDFGKRDPAPIRGAQEIEYLLALC